MFSLRLSWVGSLLFTTVFFLNLILKIVYYIKKKKNIMYLYSEKDYTSNKDYVLNEFSKTYMNAVIKMFGLC